MSNFHPRRAARKVVLEALFAHQFTCDNPRKTLEKVIKTNQLKDGNIDFMDKLFHCVIENSDFSEKLIKSHLQNWEIGRVAKVDRLLLRMGICEIFFIYFCFRVNTNIRLLVTFCQPYSQSIVCIRTTV